jgi:hypothetical protein
MEIARLIDADERSLRARVHELTAGLSEAFSVTHFTYWSTGRPPTFEAIVSASPEPG